MKNQTSNLTTISEWYDFILFFLKHVLKFCCQLLCYSITEDVRAETKLPLNLSQQCYRHAKGITNFKNINCSNNISI